MCTSRPCLTLEPPTASISLTAVVYFAHVDQYWTIVCATNSFVIAASITVLLVHLHSYGVACCNGAFACYALGAAGIAAYVIGAYALGKKKGVSVYVMQCLGGFSLTVTGELET